MSQRIKQARQAAGLSQKKMSDLLLIPLRTIENWESGKREPPLWAENFIVEKLQAMQERETVKMRMVLKTKDGRRIGVVASDRPIINLVEMIHLCGFEIEEDSYGTYFMWEDEKVYLDDIDW